MKKIKQIRTIIVLECLHCRQFSNLHGISRYKTIKNRKNTLNRLMLKKFCFFSKKHEMFKELK